MHVVVALTKCCSFEKRDRFRSLLAPIGPRTLNHEPECNAYAWFLSDSPNEVPERYMRGIEVYDNAEALTMTHRSSDEYKCMRSAMIPEAITEEPTDLRPLQPTEIGFLARHKELHDFSRGDGHEQFLVVRRFSPLAGQRGELLELLRRAVAKIDKEAEHREHIRSFWVLEYGPDLNDATIVTVERYDSRAIYEKTAELLEDLM